MRSNGWEFNLVDGVLFITAEPPETGQIALSAKAAYDLLEYLYQHHEALYEAAHPQDEPTQKLPPLPPPQEPDEAQRHIGTSGSQQREELSR